MVFSEFIKTINPDQVDTWWNTIAPHQAPDKVEEINWKYKLSKNGKALPFKWAITELSKYYQIEFLNKDFDSNVSNRDAFCEAFDFEIEEDLVYDDKENNSFQEFYTKRVTNKEIFQSFIDYANKLIENTSIHPYKVRMALTSDQKKATLILGMRAALQYTESDGKAIIGFIIQKDFAETLSNNNIESIYPFKGNDLSKSFITLYVNHWEEIPKEILENNALSFSEQFELIKNSKRVTWNTEANSTNSVLKYLIFKKENAEEWTAANKTNQKAMTFNEIINGFINYIKTTDSIVNQFSIVDKKFTKTWVWLSDHKKVIGTDGFCHYELATRTKLYPNKIFVEIHFEKNVKDSIKKEIEPLSKDFYWNPDHNHSELSLTYKKSFNLDDENLFQEIEKALIALDENFGDKIRTHYTTSINSEEKNMKVNQPLNQILYGPPGTGKTYKLQNKYFEQFTIKESTLTRERYFDQIVIGLNWWQVVSVAVLDLKRSNVNGIYAHELVKIKERMSSSKTVKPTIWGQLQAHTVRECPNVNVERRMEPLYFTKNEDSTWTIDEELLGLYFPEAFDIVESIRHFQPKSDKIIKNYDFVTFHQSFSYEDFIEGIKPKLEENDGEIAYEIKDGVFKKLCLKAEADPINTYALFIDEINRGNVSAIFGELITLIEDDKRIGEANELRVRLPYSKTEFGVPKNIHIIGTMNTADRSVESLDTALRRRFSFEEMMPEYDALYSIMFKGFNLGQVLETINERIEALLDRDHTIGHSYFISIENGDRVALQSAFLNKIIPLLQEYFYHDYEKIALILGVGFVEIQDKQTAFAKWNNKNINTPEFTPQFVLKREIEDIEEAIQSLLQN